MIRCRLHELLTVMNPYTKIVFGVSCFNYHADYQGKIKDFYETLLYRAHSCEYVSYIKVAGNLVEGYTLYVNVVLPTE